MIWLKRMLGVVLTLLLMIVSLYLLRYPILSGLDEHYFDDFALSCSRFNINSQGINLDALCVHLESANVKVTKAKVYPRQININALTITLTPSQKSAPLSHQTIKNTIQSTFAELNRALNISPQSLNISALTLVHGEHAYTSSLVMQKKPLGAELTLTGDISLTAEVAPDGGLTVTGIGLPQSLELAPLELNINRILLTQNTLSISVSGNAVMPLSECTLSLESEVPLHLDWHLNEETIALSGAFSHELNQECGYVELAHAFLGETRKSKVSATLQLAPMLLDAEGLFGEHEFQLSHQLIKGDGALTAGALKLNWQLNWLDLANHWLLEGRWQTPEFKYHAVNFKGVNADFKLATGKVSALKVHAEQIMLAPKQTFNGVKLNLVQKGQRFEATATLADALGVLQNIEATATMQQQGNSALVASTVHAQNISLESVNWPHSVSLKSTLEYDFAGQSLAGVHSLDSGELGANIQQTQDVLDVSLVAAPLTALTPLLKPYDLSFVSGSFAVTGQARLAGEGQLSVSVANGVGLRGNHVLEGLNLQADAVLKPSIRLDLNRFQLETFRSGLVLNDIRAVGVITPKVVMLSDITAKGFDGVLSVPSLQYDFATKSTSPSVLHVEQIQGKQLLALENQEDVYFDAVLSGHLPFSFQNGAMVINQGRLVNHQTGTVMVDEARLETLLASTGKELQSVLSVLSHLEFSLLSADVSLDEAGWLDLLLRIEGVNPAEAQPVNLNYSHQENINVLLRALRLNDAIKQRIEKRLEQKANQSRR